MSLFCERCGTLLSSKDQECPKCSKNNFTSSVGFTENDSLFPFKNVRDGQKQFMEDAESAFRDGRMLLAHAPTGIGKTAAALTAAVKAAGDQKIFFLTSKQSQHRIAIDTVRDLRKDISAVDVISKQHMCPLDESRSLPYAAFERFCSKVGNSRCNTYGKKMKTVVDKLKKRPLHVDELTRICYRNGVCPHKAALQVAQDAQVVVCDYNYVFSDIRETVFKTVETELVDIYLIVDEAHNLPDRIRAHLNEEISLPLLREAFALLNDHNAELAGFVKRLTNELAGVKENKKVVCKEFFDDMVDIALRGGFGRYEDVGSLIPDLNEHAVALIERDSAATAPLHLVSFLSQWQHKGKEVFRSFEPDPPTLKVSLLDPAYISAEVFDQTPGAVLMSGTLHPGEMYADLLGIGDPIIKGYISPFPPENRRVVSMNNLTTSYKNRGVPMYQAYANAIADVCNNTPGNVACFFPSYLLMNKIVDRLERVHLKKRLMVEERKLGKRSKENMVDRLRHSDDLLLVGVQGGSLSEGVDYKDNILSSVIIAGIPFPPPSLELKALQEYYTEKFGRDKGYNYTRIYPALNRVLQAAGRSIRSKNDRAIIVLMDKRFNYPGYKKCMPENFHFRPTDNLTEECRTFF
ncbi:MAG: ATP-dependent DNA helicase [Thermoplasmata archaeon]